MLFWKKTKSKRLQFLLLVCCLPLLLAAKNLDQVQIIGIKGKALANIQSRLQEMAKSKPLLSEADDSLFLQITMAMQPYGYFKPEVNIARAGENITVNIVPGPQLLVNQLSISIIGEGANNPGIQKSLANLPLKRGKPFNSPKYADTKQALLDAAEYQGYLHARFDKAEILIDKHRYTSSVILVFNTGFQYYFGQVRFNPTYISPELLQRYIPFQFGQPYSTEQLLALSDRLSGSGYFSNVSVKPDMNGQRKIPVNVYLQAANRINYSLGLGFGTDTGVRGRAGFHVIPVNRAGHKFNAIALGSLNQNTLQAQYTIPGRDPVADEYNLTGNLSTLNYDTGYSNALLMSVAQRHNLDNFQRVISLNGLYERFNYEHAAKQEKLTPFPKMTLSWKKTSDQLFSPSGYHVAFSTLGANKALFSQVNFFQTSIDARAALTLPAIRTRLYVHTIQGITAINDVNQLPLSLALLLGGADNLKAYSFNSIGPGKVISYTGLEVQKEFVDHWYLTTFFDSGDVYKPSLKSMQYDIGFGLMWVSPIGPIKVGIAQAVNNRLDRVSDRNPKFVVNMGPDL